jgi:hypothetical protein
MVGIAVMVLFLVFFLMSYLIISRMIHEHRAERAWQEARAADVSRQVRVTEVRHALDVAALNARQSLIRAALEAVGAEGSAERE